MPVNLQGKMFSKEQQEGSVLKAHRKLRVLLMCVYLFTFSVSGRIVNGLVGKAIKRKLGRKSRHHFKFLLQLFQTSPSFSLDYFSCR